MKQLSLLKSMNVQT